MSQVNLVVIYQSKVAHIFTANVKQVLTVLFAVMLFDLRISPTNAIGIALTLAGGGWYTAVDLREKKRKKFMQESLSSDINLQRPEDSP